MTAAPNAAVRGRGWFNATVGSWFAAFGMQSLLFSWLIVGELRESVEWVGIAQSTSALPQLALLMLGGAVADRIEPRRMLVGMHAVAALPPLLLAAAILTDHLSIAAVIAYGIAIGVINSFLMPARDTLLSRVAGAMMIQTVTMMTVVQFGAQIFGTLLAGTTESIGSPTILAVQALVLTSGVWFASRLPGPTMERRQTGRPRSTVDAWHQITAGAREVAGNPALRGMGILVSCVGMFFIGPFLVVFPILVRDVHDGGARALSIVLMLFPLGTIVGSVALHARNAIRQKIRVTMLALMSASMLLGAVGLEPSWPLFLALTFCWGLTGAIFINLSRAVFQEKATEANRGRVLAIYQLGLIAGAPVGAFASGFISGAFGVDVALFIAAGAMFVVVATLWTFSDVSAIE